MNFLKETLASTTELERRFSSKIETNRDFDRKLVSFQANKILPEYRWYKYKEGFSAPLVFYLFKKLNIKSGKIIDPFAGVGTTSFVARELGLDSVSIELLPIGCEIIETRLITLISDSPHLVSCISKWCTKKPWNRTKLFKPFQHLRITEGAFPRNTEKAIGHYLALAEKESQEVYRILRFALLCILEEVSYTRKDGQYLRWDSRAARKIKKGFNKGNIPSFDLAITKKLNEISQDLRKDKLDLFSSLNAHTKKGKIKLIKGSCLEILPQLPNSSFDCLITSPPYCNRYDYTRTYALELALLGISEEELRRLRQTMLSCTVENREKDGIGLYFSNSYLEKVKTAFNSQLALSSILSYLDKCKEAKLLNNSGLVRMIRNYFWEMSLWIFECARILKPNAPLIMVNDNVRYQGVEIPVDLILSEIAQKAGFDIEKIWILKKGKGNSSQQMGNHGRKELRKCVYLWKKSSAKPAKMQDRLPVLQH